MNRKEYTKQLLRWYFEKRRDLPWRNTRDPYPIWLSEIILQQTRVKQGQPYYEAFIKKFPTIWDLAEAPEDVVLRTWQGLGYYTRARNMHKCAKVITEQFNGVFPSKSNTLIKLPGIGPYTAAAISSIAFDEPVPVVDGNVFRVLSRLFGIKENINNEKSKRIFSDMAADLIPEKNPGDFNQAIMEFGALQCRPKNPDCKQCLLNSRCFAYQNDLVEQLPVREQKGKHRIRHFHYFVLVNHNRIYLQKRTQKDIWQGLYQFLLFESKSGDPKNIFSYFRKQFDMDSLRKPDLTMRHVLSHQIIKAYFYVIEADGTKSHPSTALDAHEGNYFTLDEIHSLPKPVLIENYLKERFF